MSQCYSIFLNGERKRINITYEQLGEIKKDIRDIIFSNQPYYIRSNVNDGVLNSYFEYLKDKSKIPNINSNNIGQYKDIIDEFENEQSQQILSNYLSNPEFNEIWKQAIINNVISDDVKCKNRYEKYIAQNLDYYIEKYPDEMKKIRITSLYNIFYHDDRKLINHKNAYNFLTNEKTGDLNTLCLIGCLEYSKLSKDQIKDSMIRYSISGITPKFDIDFINQINENDQNAIKELQNKNNEQCQLLQKTIDELILNKQNLEQKIQKSEQESLEKEARYNQQYISLQQKIDELNYNKQNLEQKIQNSEQESREKETRYNEQCRSLQQKIDELTQINNNLKQDSMNKEDNYNQQYRLLQQKIDDLVRNIQNYEHKMRDKEQEVLELKNQYHNQSQSMQQKITELTRSNNDLKQNALNIKKNNNEQCQTLQKTINELNQNIQVLKQKINKYEQEIKEKNEKQNEECRLLRIKVNELTTRNQNLNQQFTYERGVSPEQFFHIHFGSSFNKI